jgi:hypothetical protein
LYSTLVYYYEWQTAQESPEVHAQRASSDHSAGTGGGEVESGNGGIHVVAALERLAALLAEGVLTPEEFTQAKKRVLMG